MAIRKRKQYQIMNYTLWDFEPETGKCRREGREINIAENQIAELIQAIKKRTYNEDGINPIPELVFLEVNNKVIKEQLEERIKNGLYINNKKYVRFIRSSSMGRNGTISFIEENLYNGMMRLVSLDKIDTIDKAVISKLESYLGLAFSTTIFVNAVPNNICIIDADKFETTIEDYVKAYQNNGVEETLFSGLHEVSVEKFDGMGLHCPTWGRKVAKELDMKKAPVGYQIRLLPAFKGMSYEIDFKKFYRERNIEYIEDYTGKKYRVEDLDCIWTTSMFKFSKYFNGWDEVKELREKLYTPFNQNVIGISKWSTDEDNTDKKTKMTYQYLQSLALTGDDLKEMSNYTKDIVERVYQGDRGATLTYLGLLQDMSYVNDDGEEIDVLEENMMATKVHYAITKNPNMINDPYVQSFLQRQLNRTINDMKLGRIYVDGQYSFTCQDPILMLEMIANLEPVGSLKRGEFYSTGIEGYYATFRSPLIHSSEIGKLNFLHNETTDRWLSKYKNIIVLNGFDITAQKHGGSDHDGDTFFWTKDEKIVNAVIEEFADGTPNYAVVDIAESENRAEAVKEEYNIENIIKYDLRTLENRIGQITNIGTYFTNKGYENLKEYDKELVITRLMQGEEIDFVKHGVRTIEAPENFKDAKKYKPYFLQKYKYNRDKNIQENIENAPVNVLCKDIEEFEKELFKQDKAETIDTSDLLMDKELINADVEETKQTLEKLLPIYQDFKKDSSKLFLKCKYKNEDERREIYDHFYDTYHYQVMNISDNVELISSIAIYLNYIKDKTDNKTRSYQFPWAVCWEGLAKTIEKKAPEMIQVPRLLSKEEKEKLKIDDVFEFRGNYYQMMEIANKISADDFIIKQYEKKVEKDLKKQISNFTLKTVLYGFRDRTTDKIVDIIENKELHLGEEEYNGKPFAALFADGEYVASIRDKDEKILDDDAGYIDLKTMRNKVDIEIVEKCKSSLKVRLKLAS